MYIENSILKKYITYWLATMFCFVSIMIILGGLTRLTGSGLSITQWQLFSGILPPLNDDQWNKYFELYFRIGAIEPYGKRGDARGVVSQSFILVDLDRWNFFIFPELNTY